jgi:hypothetical protein
VATQPLIFQPGASGVSFGSGVTTAGGTFSSFVFQPGSYQLQLAGFGFLPQSEIPFTGLEMSIALSASPQVMGGNALWLGFQDAAGVLNLTPATKLVSVSAANTVIQLIYRGAGNSSFGPGQSVNVSLDPTRVGGCNLVITRVQ